MKRRLFVSIPLPETLLKELGEYLKEVKPRDLKWIAPENIHITVLFLGWIDEEMLDSIISNLSNLETFEKCSLEVEGITLAPSSKTKRMIWLTFKSNKEYKKIVQEVSKATKIKPDFKEPLPHATLARFKHKKITLPEKQIETKKIPVKKIQLMESHLKSDGPKYLVLKEYNL